MTVNQNIHRMAKCVYFDSRFSRTVIPILAIAVMSGCSTTTRIIPPPPLSDRIPGQLLTCAERPVPGDLSRQSDVARFVVDLDQAGDDCRGKIQALKGLVDRDDAGRGD